MKVSDSDRIQKILRTWEALRTQISVRGITRELLLSDTFSQWAVTTPLYNIGEQVYQLSPELKARHPELPWSKVSGLRHRLVHDYDGVNWSVLTEIVFQDMPEFVQNIRRLLDEQEAQP